MSKDDAYTLIKAAFESPEQMVELVRSNPDLLNARTGLQETPLHYLAVEDQVLAVQQLIDAGAQVNTLNSCGGTPLSEAASLGYTSIVKCLLAAGAQLRLTEQAEPTLHEAVRGGSADVVQLIVEAGAPLNEQNDIRETALHLAAESDDLHAILELLLERGANCNIKRIFDETPLDLAIEAGAHRCIETLTKHGAQRGSSSIQ